MGSGTPALEGPDLAAGIDASSIADGAMIAGHAHGQPVLVARRGDAYFAIGATCTHYGAPLGDGLIVGDELRCAWHHACFSLRTGEAVKAPALRAVPCFEVERRGGTLFVRGERSAPKLPVLATGAPASIGIVGGGAAGHAAAEALRRAGYAGKLTIFSSDEDPPCDRPNLSKDYLAGNAPEDWIPLRDAAFFAEQKIELRLGTKIVALDAATKTLTLEDGAKERFDRLLLATGGDPVRLPLPGAELPHVHTLRTVADSRRLIAATQTAKSAVVVGAGFIGLEVAASLRTRGLAVAVVAPEAVPLERVMGPQIGQALRELHEGHGVKFHLATKPRAIGESFVELEDGTKLEADLVVIGVGVRPVTALAEAAGLEVDRGVVVDAHLETSAPGIYAAGDAARFPDARTGESLRIEHWVVAQRQGQLAARNLLGARENFTSVPFFWSAHYDVTVGYVGHASAWDSIDQTGSLKDRDFAAAFRRNGKTLAVATIGRDRLSLEAEAAMERGDEAALVKLIPKST